MLSSLKIIAIYKYKSLGVVTQKYSNIIDFIVEELLWKFIAEKIYLEVSIIMIQMERKLEKAVRDYLVYTGR